METQTTGSIEVETDREEHIIGYKTLAAVLMALLVLTGVTILVAGFDLGALNIWIAILVASIKSSLVLLFFMHLKFDGWFIRITFITTIFILAILIGFLFWDIAFR